VGLFFYGRASGARVADAVRGPIDQLGIEFAAAAANGIDVEAGDQGQEDIATVAALLGFEGGQPTALLFVQAAADEVQLVMEKAFGVVCACGASGALTLMNGNASHDAVSGWGRYSGLLSVYRKDGSN
jgi:hypothetical protein